MNITAGESTGRMRCVLAILAGALFAISFPQPGVAGFGWVAPGAILACAIGLEGRQAFRVGYVAGLAHYLISLHWLLHIPVNKLAPITGWLALSAFLALYPACWVWACWRIFPNPHRTTTPDFNTGRLAAVEPLLACGWGGRLAWTLSCAALWVTWEMVQARLLTGFPWNFLGASQYRMLPVIQIASWTGVYGVSFVMAWFSTSLLGAMAVVLGRAQDPRRWMGEIALPLLVLSALLLLGWRQLNTQNAPPTPPASVKLALVQPSIPQQWIWAPAESSNRFSQLLALSETALTNPVDVLVWPEAAVPGFVRWDKPIQEAVSSLARRHQVWVVLGSDDAAPRTPLDAPGGYDVFNCGFLIDPEGRIQSAYRKQRLVIFGEYLPFHRWLPFLERWTGLGSFTPGRAPVPFELPGLRLKTSVLICFEDVFPHLVREYVEDDTDFLINLTNNGWFGESGAQWQHAASAVLRAVENGLPLVRCANNGLTCWVDPAGRLGEVYFPGTRDIYGVGVKRVEVPLLDGRRREPTFYRRHGDWLGWGCVVWSALSLGRTWRKRVVKR